VIFSNEQSRDILDGKAKDYQGTRRGDALDTVSLTVAFLRAAEIPVGYVVDTVKFGLVARIGGVIMGINVVALIAGVTAALFATVLGATFNQSLEAFAGLYAIVLIVLVWRVGPKLKAMEVRLKEK
jgi:cytochrome c biogenesis protein CcdA